MESADQLRRRMRKLRAALDHAKLETAAAKLCARLVELPEYRAATRIAAYFAVNGEIGLTPLIEHAWSQDKQVYLPNLDRKTLRFSPYFDGQRMRVNRYRLPEPDVDDDAMLAPEDLDLVLAPLVVFDPAGNRIGMGGGYYDRSFAFRREPGRDKPALIGVAHEQQRVERLVPEEWDVPLDKIVTEAKTYEP